MWNAAGRNRPIEPGKAVVRIDCKSPSLRWPSGALTNAMEEVWFQTSSTRFLALPAYVWLGVGVADGSLPVNEPDDLTV